MPRIRILPAPFAACALVAFAGLSSPAAATAPADTGSVRASAERTRVYFGMWSTHLRDISEGLDANSLIGVSYRGYYCATFINSFGDRALSLGLQRSFTPGSRRSLTTALGYRAGILTGYDERFFGIGDKLPVVPFVQIMGTVDIRNVGVELAYAGVVASVSVNWRLW